MISPRSDASPTIKHVLFDADGVLQDLPGGWYAAMEPFLGERSREFLHQTWKEERPTLSGDGDYLPMLAATLKEFDVEVPAEEIFAAVWQRLELNAEVFAVVDRLRGAGYGVHLGTNQEQHRGRYLRDALGYDDIFDVSCYSYELGVAKPDPAFFHEAARRIGADPSSIFFIDDNSANVDGARSAGLRAETWTIIDGMDRLSALLADQGVDV